MTLSIAFSVMQTPTYTSSALILSDVNTASESVLGSFFSAAMFDPDRFIKTQAEIIQTENVAQGVETRLSENYSTELNQQDPGSEEEVYVPEYVPGASELMAMVFGEPARADQRLRDRHHRHRPLPGAGRGAGLRRGVHQQPPDRGHPPGQRGPQGGL